MEAVVVIFSKKTPAGRQASRLMIIGPPFSCTPGIIGSTSQRAKTRTDRCSFAVKDRLSPPWPAKIW